MAATALTERAEAAGIEALALSPRMGDFNEDLRVFGLGASGDTAHPARVAGCRSLHAPRSGQDEVTDVGSRPSWPI
jgi:hypothetical protein